ncbi:transposase [Bradyrhizobium oropedii]|uniref:transposase n=1 Tax=Bradyrhizobium oropedii TaxID=1571201 RepID=UPI003B845C33
MIHATNAVEALYRSMRKITKTRGIFPTDEAAIELLYLAINNAGVPWRRQVEWTAAMGSSRSTSARGFPEQRADDHNRHHAADSDCLVRTFAVKPRACGAPLDGEFNSKCSDPVTRAGCAAVRQTLD